MNTELTWLIYYLLWCMYNVYTYLNLHINSNFIHTQKFKWLIVFLLFLFQVSFIVLYGLSNFVQQVKTEKVDDFIVMNLNNRKFVISAEGRFNPKFLLHLCLAIDLHALIFKHNLYLVRALGGLMNHKEIRNNLIMTRKLSLYNEIQRAWEAVGYERV